MSSFVFLSVYRFAVVLLCTNARTVLLLRMVAPVESPQFGITLTYRCRNDVNIACAGSGALESADNEKAR